jgi:protoporphyrinogen oxidase
MSAADTTAKPRVAIIGGGILGSVLALRLAQQGANVTILERAPDLGGLAGAFDFDGHRVDRFYHVVTPADDRMLALADETGLTDEVRFEHVGVGFWSKGKLHGFDGIPDLLRFKPLSIIGRLRLGLFVLACQARSSYDDLESVPLLKWLRKICGREVTNKIWKPLLDSRFDKHHDELPATYLWARTNRMRSARSSEGAGERMGHVVGGHERLVNAIGEKAREAGVDIRLGAGVEGLVMEDGAVRGVRVDGVDERFDLVVPTLQAPALEKLLPAELAHLRGLFPERFLGCVCLILKTTRSLLPCYSVNLLDPAPFTTIVETSHVLGTDHTDGLRLAYVPRYTDTDSPIFDESDDEIYARFLAGVRELVPDLRDEEIVAWTVQRARVVEPVHAMGHSPRTAPLDPGVEGLALASAAQIYPRLLNGDSVVRHAEEVAVELGARLKAAGSGETTPALAGG